MPTIVLDVLVTLDCFWPHLRSLESLSLLTRTSKSIRAGCDLAFAVSAMGANRTVEKRWAARWLGLPVRCMPARQDVMLAFALRLLASKGGLAVTHARAVEFRRKEQADKAGRIADREERDKRAKDAEAKRLQELKERADARMVDVDARLEALGILGSVREEREYRYLRNVVAQSDRFDLEFEVRDLQVVYEREEAIRVAEAERKTRLDALLAAADLPRDEGSRHYARCVRNVDAPLDASTIAEFRFIHQLQSAPHRDELARIERRLRRRAYRADLEEQTRREFRRRFNVDGDGNITGGKRKRF